MDSRATTLEILILLTNTSLVLMLLIILNLEARYTSKKQSNRLRFIFGRSLTLHIFRFMRIKGTWIT